MKKTNCGTVTAQGSQNPHHGSSGHPQNCGLGFHLEGLHIVRQYSLVALCRAEVITRRNQNTGKPCQEIGPQEAL